MSVENKKIALVTGASRGIGRAAAQMLSNNGFYVVGTATSDAGADKISAYLGSGGQGVVLNLFEDDAVTNLLAELKDKGQMPDALICNAGITADDLLLRMKQPAWDDVIAINLTSQFKLSKGCVRSMMKKRWGRIVFIGSVVGSLGNPGQPNYCAAKAGVEGLARSMAREIASRNITVNVVAPGFIQTDMTDKLAEEQVNMLMQQIPCERLGSPEDIAHMVNFLLKEHASYITGQTIHVNGGMYMG